MEGVHIQSLLARLRDGLCFKNENKMLCPAPDLEQGYSYTHIQFTFVFSVYIDFLFSTKSLILAISLWYRLCHEVDTEFIHQRSKVEK